jgi:hypothetical protein
MRNGRLIPGGRFRLCEAKNLSVSVGVWAGRLFWRRCWRGRVMVAASNAQHAPQHGGGYRQPAAYQHHNDHGQAHLCLLFALPRAHTLRCRLFRNSLAVAAFQAIDRKSAATNQFALSNALHYRLELYRSGAGTYDRRHSREWDCLASEPEQRESGWCGYFLEFCRPC